MKDEVLRKDINILEHIRDYCRNVEEIHERFGNDIDIFMKDKVYEQAIAFNVMQIGELVAKLSDAFRTETKSSIPWIAIKGMRNVVVHSYGNIDKEILWDSSIDGISTLKDFCTMRIEDFDNRKKVGIFKKSMSQTEVPSLKDMQDQTKQEETAQSMQPNIWQRRGR